MSIIQLRRAPKNVFSSERNFFGSSDGMSPYEAWFPSYTVNQSLRISNVAFCFGVPEVGDGKLIDTADRSYSNCWVSIVWLFRTHDAMNKIPFAQTCLSMLILAGWRRHYEMFWAKFVYLNRNITTWRKMWMMTSQK